MPASPGAEFLLCNYFNVNGRQIERIYIVTDERDDAADRLRQALGDRSIDLLVDAMKAEANIYGAKTSLDDAALALNALLNEIAKKRVCPSYARQIAAISVNFRRAVTIVETLPTLEIIFGGNAACWVRGIFRHLNLGPPYIH